MYLIDNDDNNYVDLNDLNLQNFANLEDFNDKNYKEKKKHNHDNKEFEEMLIEFQNFLKDKKLIEGDDDSFKKTARQFIKGRKVVSKKTAKPKPTVVNPSECDHDYRTGFNLIDGSFTWCTKCGQRWCSNCK